MIHTFFRNAVRNPTTSASADRAVHAAISSQLSGSFQPRRSEAASLSAVFRSEGGSYDAGRAASIIGFQHPSSASAASRFRDPRSPSSPIPVPESRIPSSRNPEARRVPSSRVAEVPNLESRVPSHRVPSPDPSPEPAIPGAPNAESRAPNPEPTTLCPNPGSRCPITRSAGRAAQNFGTTGRGTFHPSRDERFRDEVGDSRDGMPESHDQ